ncbi:MAG: molybdopterin molybdotransferase MoeA [Deferribacteraceae bacterium]|jgi:molybdopterin molybdotransferase|nr:molybdopterin molybdotransferase MoeA [Deferribacteraceae bacterium]
MITPSEALSIIQDKIKPLGVESIPLINACRRVLAAPFLSRRSVPMEDSSAMDGYAVRAEDTLNPPAKLKVLGVIPAGSSVEGVHIGKGECCKIMTGAFIPSGSDAVAQKEFTDNGEDLVEIKTSVPSGTHIRLAGENLAEGELLNFAGERLTPFTMSRLVSAGAIYADVYRKPRVAVLSTGTEIAPPAEYDNLKKMLDSNSPAVMAIAEEAGGIPEYLGVIPDDQKKLADALLSLKGFDLAVVSGGISVGDFDFMSRMHEAINLKWHFDKVSQKPGKPFSFGELNGLPIMAFPGNPVSTVFCAFLYMTAAILRLQGANQCVCEPESAVLGEKIAHKKGFVNYDRAKLVNENGILTAYPYKTQSSGIFFSLLACNAFLEIPSEIDVLAKGETVKAYRYK